MIPDRRARIGGSTSRASACGASTLTRKMLHNAEGLRSASGGIGLGPSADALLTRMSICPKRRRPSRTSRSAWSGSPTSPGIASRPSGGAAPAASRRIISAARASASRSRAVTMSRAPRFANARATSKPSPRDVPVMSATESLSSIGGASICGCHQEV